MHKNRFLVLLVIQILLFNNLALAEGKPLFILSTIRFDNNHEGVIVPEIAVSADGNLREATTKDFWVGQEFYIYNIRETPKLQGKVMVNSVTDDFSALFSAKIKPGDEVYYWGIYKAKDYFRYVGKGKDLILSDITEGAEKVFSRKHNSIEMMLQNVVKQDWQNIKKDFPKLTSNKVSEFISTDINGDKKTDYVLILSDLANETGAAVLAYLTDNGKFKRIPISYWENASYDESWPRLLFSMDFNGDGTKELVISDSDSDINIPIIFGWFKDKKALMELYYGETELWNG